MSDATTTQCENPTTLDQMRDERNRLFEIYDQLDNEEHARYANLNARVKELELRAARGNQEPTVSNTASVIETERVNVFVMSPGKRNNDICVVKGTTVYEALLAIGFDMEKTWIVQKRIDRGSSVEVRDIRIMTLTDENTEFFVTEKVGGALGSGHE